MDGEGSGEASETAGSVETASAPKAAEVSGTASVPKVQAEVAAPKVERWYSPAVLQLAREAKISQEELDSIPGTGYEGRLSKKDIRTYIEMKKGAPAADVSTTVVSTVSANNSGFSPVPSAESTKEGCRCGSSGSVWTICFCRFFRCIGRSQRDGSSTSHYRRPYGDVEKGFSACD